MWGAPGCCRAGHARPGASLSSMRRPWRVEKEARLRESALVVVVVGSRPALLPANIAEGLIADHPDLPPEGFQVSLMAPDAFFVRFAHRRWFDMVKDSLLAHFRGTPLVVRRWNRLTFATSHACRYSVRLFIEGVPPKRWNVEMVQRFLPECLIYQVAVETVEEADVSFFVVRAWVEDPGLLPTETILTDRSPLPCTDPFAHGSLHPGLVLEGSSDEACGCAEHIPRVLRHPTILVHVDAVAFYPPTPQAGGAGPPSGGWRRWRAASRRAPSALGSRRS